MMLLAKGYKALWISPSSKRSQHEATAEYGRLIPRHVVQCSWFVCHHIQSARMLLCNANCVYVLECNSQLTVQLFAMCGDATNSSFHFYRKLALLVEQACAFAKDNIVWL
jgi:hypothetical protein